MPSVLVDAGPLIALFDRDDKHHSRARKVLARTKATLLTTWPVVTETWHMLDFSADAQLDFLQWVYRGGAKLHLQNDVDLERVIALIRRYGDRVLPGLVVAGQRGMAAGKWRVYYRDTLPGYLDEQTLRIHDDLGRTHRARKKSVNDVLREL